MKLVFRFGSALAVAVMVFGAIGCGGDEASVYSPVDTQASPLKSIAEDPDVQLEVRETGSAQREIVASTASDSVRKAGEEHTNNEPGKCVCCSSVGGTGPVRCYPVPCGGCP